jgi:anaerobic magnesium-protoporphyrin IX monomethyl ester cyclase
MYMHRSVALIIAPLFWTHLPPLGLAYLAATLGKEKIPFTVHDLNMALYEQASTDLRAKWRRAHEPVVYNRLFSQLQNHMPDVYAKILSDVLKEDTCIYAFSVFRSNKECSLQFAREIKRAKPRSIIVFGGPEMTELLSEPAAYNDFSARGIVDAVVVGDGEPLMPKILKDAYQAQLKPLYRADPAADLDGIAYPTFEGFDLLKYQRKRALPLLASRGCVKTCEFCSERLLQANYRRRSARNIVAEIKAHISRYGAKWFTFHDSLINGDLCMLADLCRMIIDERLSIKWEAQVAIRPDMDVALMRRMKEAGCFNFFIGLESGSDRVLKKMRKGYATTDARRFFEDACKAAMHFEISLILGYPGETEKDFEDTLQFLADNKDLIPKIAQCNPFVVLPGTAIAKGGSFRAADLPQVYDPETAGARMKKMLRFFDENGFRYTKGFINNLAYGH